MVPVGIWSARSTPSEINMTPSASRIEPGAPKPTNRPMLLERIDRFLFAVVLDQLPELAKDLADTLFRLLFVLPIGCCAGAATVPP